MTPLIYIIIGLSIIITIASVVFIISTSYRRSMRYRLAQDRKNPFKLWLLSAQLIDNQSTSYQEIYDSDYKYLQERINELYYVDSREELFRRWEFSTTDDTNALDYLMYLYVWQLAVGAQYASEAESFERLKKIVVAMQQQYSGWEQYAKEFLVKRKASWEKRGTRTAKNIATSMAELEQEVQWTLTNLAPKIDFKTKF